MQLDNLRNIRVRSKLRFYTLGYKRKYCNWETFSANCSHGHVIMMTAAQYGRMRFGRCIRRLYDDDHQLADIGCNDDIIR